MLSHPSARSSLRGGCWSSSPEAVGSLRWPRLGSRGSRKEASFPLAVPQLSFSPSWSFVEQLSWAYLPVRHLLSSPVKDRPGQPGGGDGAGRAQFTGRSLGLLKSHPSRRICRPGLLVTGTRLSWFFIVAVYLSSPPGLQHLSSLWLS